MSQTKLKSVSKKKLSVNAVMTPDIMSDHDNGGSFICLLFLTYAVYNSMVGMSLHHAMELAI